jgi:hypothetical protein
MKLDLVAAEALGVEGFQLRRVLVGDARRIEHRGRAPAPAEFGERRRLAPAPFAVTASTSARSLANRSTFSNGGDWLTMSWVSKRSVIAASFWAIYHAAWRRQRAGRTPFGQLPSRFQRLRQIC